LRAGRSRIHAAARDTFEENGARLRALRLFKGHQSSRTSFWFTRTLSRFTVRVCLMMLG